MDAGVQRSLEPVSEGMIVSNSYPYSDPFLDLNVRVRTIFLILTTPRVQNRTKPTLRELRVPHNVLAQRPVDVLLQLPYLLQPPPLCLLEPRVQLLDLSDAVGADLPQRGDVLQQHGYRKVRLYR